jgi:hypothetical protein
MAQEQLGSQRNLLLRGLGFEGYERTRKSNALRVSISKGGQIYINSAALEEFGLDGATHVSVFFDVKLRRIAVAQASPEDVTNAFPMRRKEKSPGGAISARGFLDKFRFPYRERTRRWEPHGVAEVKGVLVIDLDDEIRREEKG